MKKLIIIPFLFICNFGITQNNVISQIIGIPILIDKILVAQNDFLFKMNCEDAKYECKKLGKVWTLPTKKELNILNLAWRHNFLYGSQNLDHIFEN